MTKILFSPRRKILQSFHFLVCTPEEIKFLYSEVRFKYANLYLHTYKTGPSYFEMCALDNNKVKDSESEGGCYSGQAKFPMCVPPCL